MNSTERELTMQAHEEPKQEESIQDQPASPDLEIEADELEQEDTDNVSGGHPVTMYMAG
jgi:hypothetical protein